MLSDVLFEARQDIEFYQEAYPDLYDQYREELEGYQEPYGYAENEDR